MNVDDLVTAARKWADDYDLAWTSCDCEDDCPHEKAMARYKFVASESTMVRHLADALSALQDRTNAAEARVRELENVNALLRAERGALKST